MDYKSVSEDGIWQERAYQEASAAFYSAETRADYLKAKSLLSKLHGYSDTENMITVCEEKIAAIDERDAYAKAEELIKNGSSAELREALTILDALEDFRGVDWLRKEAKGKLFRKNITFLLIIVSVIMFAGGVGLVAVKSCRAFLNRKNARIYNKAVNLLNKGEYYEASILFNKIYNYSDASKLYTCCCYAPKYSDAVNHYTRGDYVKALDIFKNLDGYKRASEYKSQIESEIYKNASLKKQQKDYLKSLELFSMITGSKDVDAQMTELTGLILKSKGMRVSLDGKIAWGNYEQDNVSSNGKERILWDVRSIGNKRFLFLANKVLDCKQYNNKSNSVAWRDSYLCKWLNKSFIKSFTEEEKKYIVPLSLDGLDVGMYSPAKSSSDECRIFCISLDELKRYYAVRNDKKDKNDYVEKVIRKYKRDSNKVTVRNVYPTSVARHNNVFVGKSGTASYWLRSKYSSFDAEYAGALGIGGRSCRVNDKSGVRPAMILDFN